MIVAEDLTKKFGSTIALDRVSFHIGEGSIFGLIGSNGAGKSTMLRTCAGIYAADGGSLTIGGQNPFENSDVKGRLFFVPDYPYFFIQSSLKDMADFYKKLYPYWDQNRYDELCKLFPIDSRQRISNMSKGMQRQSALILALSTRPQVLLLDEVFDGLDPVMRLLLKRILVDDVAQSGMTVVIASHNLRELEDLCDHVGLLHKGGVLLEKELDALKLGINKVQAAFKPALGIEAFAGLDIIKFETRGSLVNMTVRGRQEDILEKINALNPMLVDILPLTLEEVFISEMEVAGYDIQSIIQ